MNLGPDWISFIAFLLIGFSSAALIDWHLSGDRPLIFSTLGILGNILDLGSTLVIVAGGLSLIVWSFAKLSWYLPIVFFVGSMVVVQVVSVPPIVRAFVTSALTPLLGAAGIVLLHWLTWFA